MIDHRIERVSISINLSKILASIMIEINSKKDVFWHVFLDIFRVGFSPKTVPWNVRNITDLAAEIANKCCWDESARNRLWTIIDRLYPTKIHHGNPSRFLLLTSYQLSCEILERFLILSSHIQLFTNAEFNGSMIKFPTQLIHRLRSWNPW